MVVVAVVAVGMLIRRRIEGGRMVTRVRVEPLAIDEGSMYIPSLLMPLSYSPSLLCDCAMLLSSKVTREERVIVLGAVSTRGRDGRTVTEVPVRPEREVCLEEPFDTTEPPSSS